MKGRAVSDCHGISQDRKRLMKAFTSTEQEELYAETRKRAGTGNKEPCPAERNHPGGAGVFQEQP